MINYSLETPNLHDPYYIVLLINSSAKCFQMFQSIAINLYLICCQILNSYEIIFDTMHIDHEGK